MMVRYPITQGRAWLRRRARPSSLSRPAVVCTPTHHVGPIEPRPEMTAWLRRLHAEAGLDASQVAEQVRCSCCGSDVSRPAEVDA